MADINTNIDVNINTSNALANLKALQKEISAFHQNLSRGGAAAAATSSAFQQNLINTINATGKFTASMQSVATSTESFTTALEKNKLSMGEYFKYAGGASRSFGKLFKTEFDTIQRVAVERVKTLQTQYIKMGRDANGALKTIAIRPLTLDMDNLATKTQIAAQRQQLLNQLLKQGSTNLLNFGKNTQWAGRQLMVGFTIPLTVLGSTAAKAYKQLEEASIQFKRVYGDMNTSAQETNNMAKAVQGLALEFTKYGVAVGDTMSMAADAAAMGKTGAELQAQVAQASKLAVLGNIDQKTALETTISLTNAFGISADKLSQKINFLNAVENQTSLSLADVTEAIPKAAPVIKQLGGNVEDLTFFLTAMKEGGINASEGANALKSGLASLINPSTKAVKMLESYGINLRGIVEADKGNVKKTVLDFAEALNKLDPLKRAQAIEALFGKFQFSRISTLLQNVTQQGSQASTVLGLASASAAELAGLSNKELSKISESPLFKFQKSIEDFKAALAPVGEQFMKAVTPIINFGTDVLKAFNKLDDGTKGFVTNAIGLLAGIGPIAIMTFGLLANGVAQVIKGFTFVKSIFNKASTASTVLGETTNYMTDEQLRAAAVASSLEQVHNKLTQAFTVETASINALTAAYERMIGVQGSRTPIIPGGPIPPVRKASGGFVFGPGTGTSDSIPAMLSNGEAVIPAKQAAKYPSLINGIISGNVFGFAKGKKSTATTPKGIRQDFDFGSAPSAITTQKNKMSWNTKDAELAALQSLLDQGLISESQFRDMMFTHASHVNPDFTSDPVLGEIKRWRAENIIADSGAVNKFNQRLTQSGGQELFDKIDVKALASQTGATQKAIKEQLAQLRQGIHPTTELGAQVMQSLARLDNHPTALSANAVLDARLTPGSDFYPGLSQRKFNSAKDEAVQASVDKRLLDAKETLARNLKNAGVVNQETQKIDEDLNSAKSQEVAEIREETAARRKYRRATSGGVVTPGQTQSGAKTGYRRASRPGDKEVREAAELAAAEAARFTPAGNYSQEAGPARPNFKQSMQSRLSGIASGQRVVKGSGGKLMGLSLVSGIGSMVGGPVGEVSGAISMVSGVMSLFGGGIDKIIPKIAGLALNFGKFIPYVGIAITAFTALSFIANELTKAERERIQKEKNLAKSTSTENTSAIGKSVADYFGVQISDKGYVNNIQAQQSQKQYDAAGEFRKSDAFKNNEAITETVKNLKTATGSQQDVMLSNLAMSLSAQGLPNDAIQTAIDAVKQESGSSSNVNLGALSLTKNVGKNVRSNLASVSLGGIKGRKTASRTGTSGVSTIFSEEDTAKIKTYANVSATSIKLLRTNLDAGKISVKEFDDGISALTDDIKSMDAGTATKTIHELTTALGFSEEQTKLIDSLQSVDDKLLVIEASAVNATKALELAAVLQNGDASAIADARKQLEEMSTLAAKNKELVDTIFKKGKKVTLEQVIKTDPEKFKALKGQQKWFDGLSAVQQKYAIQYFLEVKASMSDSELDDFIAKKMSLGKNWKDNSSFRAMVSGADRSKYADMYATEKTVTTVNKLIKDGELTDTTGGGGSITRSDVISAGLTIISQKEDEINKKYDERVKTLSKINDFQKQIAQQTQDQLDIAEALSQGDIAAAARAQEKMKQNMAQVAFDRQQQALEDQRNAELSRQKVKIGKRWYTRAQLEAMTASDQANSAYDTIKGGKLAMGGIVPQYFANGGSPFVAIGTDSIPAMLTPGEFIVSKSAVDNFGVGNLKAINNGTYSGGDSVYNYSVSVSVNGSNANVNDIANTVIDKIRAMDSQRIRSNSF